VEENVMENLESRNLSYAIVEEFLLGLKEEFGGGDNETIKVAASKKVEQESKIIEEFVQELKRVARSSRYERCPLIEEFKREMSRVIRRKLMKAEKPSRSIDQ